MQDQWLELIAAVPAERVLYHIAATPAGRAPDWPSAVRAALADPIGSPPLAELARAARSVVILVDDVTRPTPQHELLPPLLDELNEAGIPDGQVTILIALGTHRYMTRAEMRTRFGEAVCARVNVLNHAWRDEDTFIDLGETEGGVPVRVNRIAYEAGLLIGVGGIVPHVWAGWAGGSKIVLPGVCSAHSIAPMHALAGADGADLLTVAGSTDTASLRQIEQVAERVGLRFIINVVMDAEGAPIWVGAGHPAPTHKAGIEAARRVLVQDVPSAADIVIADARPVIKDYWQGLKALTHAERGLVEGGTVILVGSFPEGIAPTHPEFARHARKSPEQILRDAQDGRIAEEVIVTTLRLHAMIMQRSTVICLSDGMSREDKEALGFLHADGPREALEAALAQQGESARIGIIEYAGDVLPRVRNA